MVRFETVFGKNDQTDYRKIEKAFRVLSKQIFTNDFEAAREGTERLYAEYLSDLSTDIHISRAYFLSLGSMLEGKYSDYGLARGEPGLRRQNVKELYETCLSMLGQLIQRRDEGKNSRKNFDTICEFINKHYSDTEISASVICQQAGLSYGTISALFKRYYGGTVMDYLNEVRIMKAKELLADGKTVSEAAAELGYYEPRAFIRVFKKLEGVTPGKYMTETGKLK